MAHAFSERLAAGPLLCDGAMGTLLYARGVPLDGCFDVLNLNTPALVQAIHSEYIAAGADCIETNTFGANRFKLAVHGLGSQVREINLRGGIEHALGGARADGARGRRAPDRDSAERGPPEPGRGAVDLPLVARLHGRLRGPDAGRGRARGRRLLRHDARAHPRHARGHGPDAVGARGRAGGGAPPAAPRPGAPDADGRAAAPAPA